MGYPLCYGYKNFNDEIRKNSSSGGLFATIGEMVLDQNGVVFGAAMTDNLKLKHTYIEDKSSLISLLGSKYMQSEIGDCYIQVRNFLKENRKVLFSGTPCQIAGLRNYLKEFWTSENLLTCDIICHGVSSPLIWKDYADFEEKKQRSKIIKVNFRDKSSNTWHDRKESLYFEGGIKISADSYADIYYTHEAFRPACFSCKFTSVNRVADLTIGDFWGIETSHPNFYDELGVSLLLVNTLRGENVLVNIKKQGSVIATNLKDTIQPQLYKPVRKPVTRAWFWKIYKKKGISGIIKANNNISGIRLSRIAIRKGKKVIKLLLRKNEKSS